MGMGQGVAAQRLRQPDADAVHAQFDRIVDALADKLPAVATHLEEARANFPGFGSRLAPPWFRFGAA